MVVAVLAVHVAVGDLFGGGSAHRLHLAAELQRLAGQRVVAVQVHFRALDLHHVEHLRRTVDAGALQAAAHLYAGRKFAFGDGSHQRFVVRTKGLFGAQVQGGGKAGFLAFQRSFDLGENVVVTTVQVGQVARIERLAFRGW